MNENPKAYCKFSPDKTDKVETNKMCFCNVERAGIRICDIYHEPIKTLTKCVSTESVIEE